MTDQRKLKERMKELKERWGFGTERARDAATVEREVADRMREHRERLERSAVNKNKGRRS